MRTLPEMLATVARQNAGRTAVVDGMVAINYEALEKRVAALAGELHNLGIRRGDRVALLLPNGVDFITGYFAIVTAGWLFWPVVHHYQQTELFYTSSR